MPMKHFSPWITLIGFLFSQPIEGQFSCYQCNVDILSGGISTDCTDPYVPSPIDHLLACPQNESHHCLKAAISYNNIDLTVRACIPSRTVGTYCAVDSFGSAFPGAEINCYYCEDEACNHSNPLAEPFCELMFGLVALVIANSRDVIIG